MPPTSSTASCLPGMRSDSCPCAKAEARAASLALRPGLRQLQKGKKALSYSKCRVYSRKGCVPLSFPPLYPTLQRTCALIALPSTPGASCFLPGSWVDLLIPKHCASDPIVPWQCHQFPESRYSLLFTPIVPGAVVGKGGDCRCSRRAVARLAAGTACPCGYEACVLVCTGQSPALCPRLVLGICHPLPRSRPSRPRCPVTVL